MENVENNNLVEIDLVKLLKLLWRKAWILLLVAILGAGAAFGYSKFFVTPKYQSVSKMYVNNISSTGSSSLAISGSDLTAAKSLAKTYIEILMTNGTLDKVIDKANLVNQDGSRMNALTLKKKISAEVINSTEIFEITVTDTDPERAQLIANTITEVLPTHIATIVEGSSVRTIQSASLGVKIAPRVARTTAIGFLLGALLASLVIILRSLLDPAIHDESYLLETYHYPLLAVIPDLERNSGNGHFKKKHTYGYGYGSYGYYQKDVGGDAVSVTERTGKSEG